METLIRFIKDEATGEWIKWPVELDYENDYLAYEGGEVWFSFTNIKVGQVEGSDYFAYQWTCSYDKQTESGENEQSSWTRLSRVYDTLADATEALLKTLTEKERYAEVLNFVTNGEQTLEQLGLFLDAE